MKVPHHQLDPETLTRLLSELVSRDGTDYGEKETTLADRIACVRAQLHSGAAVIVFDPASETCALQTKEQFARATRGG